MQTNNQASHSPADCGDPCRCPNRTQRSAVYTHNNIFLSQGTSVQTNGQGGSAQADCGDPCRDPKQRPMLQRLAGHRWGNAFAPLKHDSDYAGNNQHPHHLASDFEPREIKDNNGCAAFAPLKHDSDHAGELQVCFMVNSLPLCGPAAGRLSEV